MWSKYKVQSRSAWFKFWNSRGLLTGHFLPVPGAFTCVLLKFLSWKYIEYFFIGWTVLFTANPDDILSLTQPQISATWRPWRFAFKWPCALRFLSALFCALLPIFLLSFDLNLSFFRCSWLLVALWRVKKKTLPGCRPPRWRSTQGPSCAGACGAPNSN